MTDAATNKQICVKFIELANSGQFDAAGEFLHDDAVWWINGDLPSSGTTRGKDAVMKLYKSLEHFMQVPLKMNYTALTAEEDRVAVEMNGDCKFLDGRPYRTVYHMLYKLVGGKIIRCHEYFDTKYVSEVFQMDSVQGGNLDRIPPSA